MLFIPALVGIFTLLKRRANINAKKFFSLCLDVSEAIKITGEIYWQEQWRGRIIVNPEIMGDVVIARKDFPTSYHLAVVHDDAIQCIDLVTRGEDLFTATHIHRLLQELLGLPVPEYYHHPLILDEKGERLAKRKNSPSLRELRAQGLGLQSLERDFRNKIT